LSHTIRLEPGFKKIRVFLGVDLSKEKLINEIKRKKSILKDKIDVAVKTT
jgi:hypothetical protein